MSRDLVFTLRSVLGLAADSVSGCGQGYTVVSDNACLNLDNSDELRITGVRQTVAALYDQLHRPVYRYLLWMRVPHQEAEEILQESFLRLFSHLYNDGPNVNMRAWIYRVAHNLACIRTRKQKFLLEVSPERWDEICASTVDSTAGPEEVLLYKEQMQKLHCRMMTLSELQQNCVRLRLEGLRYQEIAETLNIPMSTVAGSLRHAIQKLCKTF